jgi:cyanophycinase
VSGPGVLALVGGGEWTDGFTFDAGLLEASGGSEVLVLPTGSAYEDPAGLVAAANSWFAQLGATVRELPVLTRRDAFVPELAEAARAARFVYLAGTSPMHLRSVLKDTPVLDAVIAAWQDGAVLAGTAAGADVLCDPMVDTRGGAFTVGLGVVVGLSVIPRADGWSAEKVDRTVALAPKDLALVCLPEATAVIRAADGTWRSEGTGEVTVYRGGVPIPLGDVNA